MQNKIVFTTIIFASLLLSISPAFAAISVKPAKLGILTLTTQPLFPTVYQGTFDIGNTYNFSLNVTVEPSENISSILFLSETNLTLQPNQNATISFAIKPSGTGVYDGSVLLRFTNSEGKMNLAYQDDIVIIVKQSDSYILVLIALAAVVIIVAVSLFAMKKRNKPEKMKK